MSRWIWVIGLAIASLFVGEVGKAHAAGTITVRSSGMRSTGARRDCTVPYLTTGKSAFMDNAVAPRIYASPNVDDPKNPQAVPVFNLIFYGSKEGFGQKSNGAKSRTP